MFELVRTNISFLKKNLGIKIFKNKVFKDKRGQLSIKFEGKIKQNFKHISFKESLSKPYVARGLHHQRYPFGQCKIIIVKEGEILDFIYDTKLKNKKIYYFNLKSKNNISILIPERFAHGFITLTQVKFQYICIGKYSKKHESTYNIFKEISKKIDLKKIIQSNKDKFSPNIKITIKK